MSPQSLSFVHRFEPATAAGRPPVLLLHGTGGDESDLLPLGRLAAPGSALLSPRGKVQENGMPRFFRRLAEGVFDAEDVRRRASELADFIGEARQAYGIGAPVAVGFSNGANMAAATLLLHPQALGGAALLRAMVPLSDPPAIRLDGTPVLLVSGSLDPIVPADNSARLARLLEKSGASVQHKLLPLGHHLSQQDVVLVRAFLEGLAPTT